MVFSKENKKTTKLGLSFTKTFIRIIIRAFATTVSSSGIENENLKIKLNIFEIKIKSSSNDYFNNFFY